MFSLDAHGYIVCFSCSKVLSISKKFAPMLHAGFSTPNCVFHEDFACEFIYHLLCGFLAEQGTLSQFSCRGPNAQNGLLIISIVNFLRRLVHWRSTPHFWVEVVSTSTYLITFTLPRTAGWHSSRAYIWLFPWLLIASFVWLCLLHSCCPRHPREQPNWLPGAYPITCNL